MEVLRFIIKNYGPAIASVIVMVYLCFFTKKSIGMDEQGLKDSVVSLLRENAELKVCLKETNKLTKETIEKLKNKVEELEEQIDALIERSESNEPNNERIED